MLDFAKANHIECMICKDREKAHLQEMSINKDNQMGNLITFCICDECIAKMENELIEYLN